LSGLPFGAYTDRQSNSHTHTHNHYTRISTNAGIGNHGAAIMFKNKTSTIAIKVQQARSA